ncbi:hypothetical protein [Streptomyces inhibens]|nr:hypothetical protein [Streptomyces inhibens]
MVGVDVTEVPDEISVNRIVRLTLDADSLSDVLDQRIEEAVA